MSYQGMALAEDARLGAEDAGLEGRHMGSDELYASQFPIRKDLLAAHRTYLEYVSSPGTWWTASERLAIAAEGRAAERCALCRERKAALSPSAVSGEHADSGDLPGRVVEVIHRVRSDPGRLSKAWFDGVLDSGLGEGPYVELIGVTAISAGIDAFARALGVRPLALPNPKPGEPTRYRPRSATADTAWVPMIAPEEAVGAEADLYDEGMVPNIERALSLVPNEVRALRSIAAAHYMSFAQIADPTTCLPNLDRLQIELIAGRVSAMNECFY